MSITHFLRQTINLPGLVHSLKLLHSPQLFLPRLTCPLNDINLDYLKKEGVKYVVFDKDNTLSVCYGRNIHESIRPKIDEFKAFFPSRIAILSNSVGCCDDIGFRDAIDTERSFNIPVIRHIHKKPNCLEEVLFVVSLLVHNTFLLIYVSFTTIPFSMTD